MISAVINKIIVRMTLDDYFIFFLLKFCSVFKHKNHFVSHDPPRLF